MSAFRSVSEIKAANHAAGQHWFEPDTMRFFRSRVGSTVIGGRYFISSEQYDYDSPRRYSVRQAFPDGTIDTVGEFMGYATHAQALAAAKTLAQSLD